MKIFRFAWHDNGGKTIVTGTPSWIIFTNCGTSNFARNVNVQSGCFCYKIMINCESQYTGIIYHQSKFGIPLSYFWQKSLFCSKLYLTLLFGVISKSGHYGWQNFLKFEAARSLPFKDLIPSSFSMPLHLGIIIFSFHQHPEHSKWAWLGPFLPPG